MGFKSGHFFKKVDENLHCAICHDVFENPLTCKDGHTFCSECIEKWLQGNTKCPADNRPLNNVALVRNLAVKGIIDNMDVYCDQSSVTTQKTESRPSKRIKIENSPNDTTLDSTFHDGDDEGDKQNCFWTGKLHELETHRKTCGFQPVTCPYEKCRDIIKRKDLEKHKEICKYKRVVCKECASQVVECKLQEHLENDCPDALVPCPNNCCTDGVATKRRRMDLDEHLTNVCSKAMVCCPLEEHGCLVQVERQHVNKHVQDNMAAHMSLLGKKCSALTKDNQLLRDELNDIKEEFHNQLSSTFSYTWVVPNYPNLSRNNPNGSRIISLTFWLRGDNWRFSLYPNGRDAEVTGFLSLYLNKGEDVSQALSNDKHNICSNELAIPFRLTVISQRPETHHVSLQTKHIYTSNNKSRGWPRFMKASDAISSCYCKNGSLTIQCTIQPDQPQ